MQTICITKPQRGMIGVLRGIEATRGRALEGSSIPLGQTASHLNGWYEMARKTRALCNRPFNNGWDQFEAKLSGVKSFKLILKRK